MSKSGLNLVTYPGNITDEKILKKLHKLETLRKPSQKELTELLNDPKKFMQRWFIALPVATVLLMASGALFSEKDSLIQYIHSKLYPEGSPASLSAFVAKLAQNYSSIDQVAGDQRYLYQPNTDQPPINLENIYLNNYKPLVEEIQEKLKIVNTDITIEARDYYNLVSFPIQYEHTLFVYNSPNVVKTLDTIVNYSRVHYMNQFVYKMHSFMSPFYLDMDGFGNFIPIKVINVPQNGEYVFKNIQLSNAQIHFGDIYTTYYNEAIKPYINSWGNLQDENRIQTTIDTTLNMLNQITINMTELIDILSDRLNIQFKQNSLQEIMRKLKNSKIEYDILPDVLKNVNIDLSTETNREIFISKYQELKNELEVANNYARDSLTRFNIPNNKNYLKGMIESLVDKIQSQGFFPPYLLTKLADVLSTYQFSNAPLEPKEVLFVNFTTMSKYLDIMLEWVKQNFQNYEKTKDDLKINLKQNTELRKLNENLATSNHNLDTQLQIIKKQLQKCQEIEFQIKAKVSKRIPFQENQTLEEYIEYLINIISESQTNSKNNEIILNSQKDDFKRQLQLKENELNEKNELVEQLYSQISNLNAQQNELKSRVTQLNQNLNLNENEKNNLQLNLIKCTMDLEKTSKDVENLNNTIELLNQTHLDLTNKFENGQLQFNELQQQSIEIKNQKDILENFAVTLQSTLIPEEERTSIPDELLKQITDKISQLENEIQDCREKHTELQNNHNRLNDIYLKANEELILSKAQVKTLKNGTVENMRAFQHINEKRRQSFQKLEEAKKTRREKRAKSVSNSSNLN